MNYTAVSLWWILSGTTRVSRYQKKHSLTTLIVVINHPYLLSPSATIHGILRIQSTCSTVFFHNLSASFLWSTSWPGTLHFILHTFLHPIIVIFAQCPYHRNMFCPSNHVGSIGFYCRSQLLLADAFIHVRKKTFEFFSEVTYP